jgi:diaminohydroxyphosphoribosylaminopyrimidine deaminase/5-amino-6-(5-phosphoribosylamino)uracil reductase
MEEEIFMKKVLKLARKGYGETSPNPMVGAILVKNGEILASGYHKFAGAPHAEKVVFEKAKENSRGATLYVNLEPCVHYDKKTPPCVPEIIKYSVKKVVISMEDPNPKVNKKGIEELRKNGIEVITGVLRKESEELNEIFIKNMTHQLPFVSIKVAESIDGKIATNTGESKWITGEKSRKLVQKIRYGYDGIMVGVNTVILDNPALTVRYKKFKVPYRIVLDNNLRIPLNSKIVNDKYREKTIIVTKIQENPKLKELKDRGVKIISINENFSLKEIIKLLYEMGICSILIEGGGEVISSSLFSGIVDKVYFFISPKIIGGREAKTSVEGKGISELREAIKLQNVKIKKIEEDILITGYVKNVYRNS